MPSSMLKFIREKARLNRHITPAPQAKPSVFPPRTSQNGNINLENSRSQRHEILRNIPENADSVRIPVELEGWSDPDPMNGTTDEIRAAQPQNRHLIKRKPIIEGEIQRSRAYRTNEAAAKQKAAAELARRMFERRENASTDSVCRLRELIRERYALDLEVWNKRDVHKANRRLMVPKCEKADSLLQQIYWIVNAWEEDQFEEEEWRMVEKIRACLWAKQLDNGESNAPAIWMSLLPWDRRDEGISEY